MESSSPSVQYQHFQFCQLHRIDVEKDATRNRRRGNCGKVEAGVEPGLADCGKLFYSAEFECIKSSGDTQSTQSARFESHIKKEKLAAGGSNQNDAASSSRVWLSDAKTKDSARKELSIMCKETCRRKFLNHRRRRRLDVAAQLPHISCLYSTSQESLLESSTATQSQARRQNGRPRCEYADMENVCDCHSASRSSSWNRLFGEFTFNPKSATTNSETIVRCDKVGQGPERNTRNISNRLARTFWKKTILLTDRAVRLSTAKAYVFSDSGLCMGRILKIPSKPGRRKSIGL